MCDDDGAIRPLNDQVKPLTAAMRAHAFLLLVRGGRPVRVEELGVPDGWTVTDVQAVVDDMVEAGRVTVDDDGVITGSLGLSVLPTGHVLDLPDGERYTWCALDAVGVFGALGASGQIRSATPDGEPVVLDMESGWPREPGSLAVLLPDRTPGPTVRTWCPLVNFFADLDRARAWAEEHSVPGEALSLEEAAKLGTRLWSEAIEQAHLVGDWRHRR